jgi:hypothetical protein
MNVRIAPIDLSRMFGRWWGVPFFLTFLGVRGWSEQEYRQGQ